MSKSTASLVVLTVGSILVIVTLDFCGISYNSNDSSAVIVSTANGKVKGKVVNLKVKNTNPVCVFRNIPFAKPPVGKLRFLAPQPAESWEGVRDALIPGNLPIHPKIIIESVEKYFPIFYADENDISSEDCLHLSIYAPRSRKSKKLPVMVFLHGGGFVVGGEKYFDGTVLAGMNDVVVVIPNYRVGIFGFLSLASSVCPGNAGIMDQQMALKWVRDNIENFGGDKNNVVLFGESAGAVSVQLHTMSPLSHGLFHKVISHSGQANFPGVFHTAEVSKKQKKILLDHFKIDGELDEDILAKLQNITAQDLLLATLGLQAADISFRPTYDGRVFPKTPEQCLKEKNFEKVPYIIGCNDSEGDGVLQHALMPGYAEGLSEQMAKNAIEAYLSISDIGFEKCKDFYITDKNDDKRFSILLGNVTRDASYFTPAVNTASVYASVGVPVYMYLGAFQLKMFREDKYGPGVGRKPDWCNCDHTDDLFMTFGLPFSDIQLRGGAKFTDEEAEISRKFMIYLTNFAKTGNPNWGKPVDTEWPRYKPNGEHLVVASNYHIGDRLGEKQVAFWNNVMPRFLQ